MGPIRVKMASRMLINNHKLEAFFSKHVQLRQTKTREIVAKVIPIVEDIVRSMNKADGRFCAVPKKGGSFYQGLKVNRADEFDLSIVLMYTGPLEWLQCNVRGEMCFNFTEPGSPKWRIDGPPREIEHSDTPVIPPGDEYRPVYLPSPSNRLNFENLCFRKFLIPYYVNFRVKYLMSRSVDALRLTGNFIGNFIYIALR